MRNNYTLVLRSIAYLWKNAKCFFLLTIITNVISTVDFFFLAYLTKKTTNEIIESISSAHLSNELLFFIFAIMISRIIIVCINNFFSFFSTISQMKYNDLLMFETHSKLSNISIEFFDNPNKMSTIEIAISNSSFIIGLFNNIVTIIFCFLSTLFIVILSAKVNWMITITTIVVCLPTYFINKKIKNRNYEMEKHLQTESRKTNYFLRLFHDQNSNITIKIYDLTKTISKKYNLSKESINNKKIKFIKKSNLIYCLTGIGNLLINNFQKIIIIYNIVAGSLTFGDYTLLTAYITKLQSSINGLADSISEQGVIIKKLEDYYSYIDLNPVTKTSFLKIKDLNIHNIEFRNVCFKYPGTEKIVLNNISFKFFSTESIALAGLNGAGKTTIVKLLLRLYSPTSGTIFLDGNPISDYDLKEYYNVFSSMFQELTPFQFRIDENIALGVEERKIDSSRIKDALIQSGSNDLIKNQHSTLGREFDQNGINVSRGQLQKVMLARTLYRNSIWYIFDEPSASVDAISEKIIFDKILSLKNNHGIILISHRLCHLSGVDKIIFIEDGQIVELGNHSQLIAKGGEYKKLFDLQASAYK